MVEEFFFESDLTDEDIAEVDRLFGELEKYYKQNLPTSGEDFWDTFLHYAKFLTYNLKNIPAVLEKLKESIALFKDDSETSASKIFATLEKFFDMFYRRRIHGKTWDDLWIHKKTYPEDLICCELILNFCREHFVEDAPETLKALEKLIMVCNELNDHDNAERYIKELIAAKEKNPSPSHTDVISDKEWLAETLHEAEKYDEEIAWREQIIKCYTERAQANVTEKRHCRWCVIYEMSRIADIFEKTG